MVPPVGDATPFQKVLELYFHSAEGQFARGNRRLSGICCFFPGPPTAGTPGTRLMCFSADPSILQRIQHRVTQALVWL